MRLHVSVVCPISNIWGLIGVGGQLTCPNGTSRVQTCAPLPFVSLTNIPYLLSECMTGKFPSLVSRPFQPPVFDRILYAKTEGGAGRVTCVTSDRREGRH